MGLTLGCISLFWSNSSLGRSENAFYHTHLWPLLKPMTMTGTLTSDCVLKKSLGQIFLLFFLEPQLRVLGRQANLNRVSLSVLQAKVSQGFSWSLPSEACLLCFSSYPIKLALAAFLHYCMWKDYWLKSVSLRGRSLIAVYLQSDSSASWVC